MIVFKNEARQHGKIKAGLMGIETQEFRNFAVNLPIKALTLIENLDTRKSD
jgi:hypothetical protein